MFSWVVGVVLFLCIGVPIVISVDSLRCDDCTVSFINNPHQYLQPKDTKLQLSDGTTIDDRELPYTGTFTSLQYEGITYDLHSSYQTTEQQPIIQILGPYYNFQSGGRMERVMLYRILSNETDLLDMNKGEDIAGNGKFLVSTSQESLQVTEEAVLEFLTTISKYFVFYSTVISQSTVLDNYNKLLEWVTQLPFHNARVLSKLTSLLGPNGILAMMKQERELFPERRIDPQDLPQIDSKGHLIHYVDEILVFTTHEGHLADWFYTSTQIYDLLRNKWKVGARFYGTTVFEQNEAFANVIGSTDDPQVDGMSWIELWRSQFGPVTRCTSYNFGRTCSSSLVGGHIILGTVPKSMPAGSIVYIMPICVGHNNDDSIYMEAISNRNAVVLSHYMQKSSNN